MLAVIAWVLNDDANPVNLILCANRWCEQDFVPMATQLKHDNYNDGVSNVEFQLVFDGYAPTEHSKL